MGFSPRTETLLDHAGHICEAKGARLTDLRREVLGLMAQGRSNQGIAETLVVTVSAVERHVTGIFSKLGLPHDGQEHRRVLAVLQHLRR